MVAVGLAVPPPTTACSRWTCWLEEAGRFFKDIAADLAGLTYDVVTLDPVGAFYDLIDVVEDVVCPGVGGFGYLIATYGFEKLTYNDQCKYSGPPIEPEVLDKLKLYFNSSFESVVIHENCDFDDEKGAVTFGEHIYFSRGGFGYRPLKDNSNEMNATGFAMLAHELVHVLQYRREGFGNFACQYGIDCGFGALFPLHGTESCRVEQQAYIQQALVRDDAQRDGDGIFTCAPDDQEWHLDNIVFHSCDNKPLLDNCTGDLNPGQEDADGDGVGNVCDGKFKSDIVTRGVDGTVAIWHNGTNPFSMIRTGAVDQSWQIQGVGDFDGNGTSDILWRYVDGTVAIWPAGWPEGSYWPGAVDQSWQIQGIGKFD